MHDFDDALDLEDEFGHEVWLKENRDRESREVALGVDFFHVELLDVDFLAEHRTGNAVERTGRVVGFDGEDVFFLHSFS